MLLALRARLVAGDPAWQCGGGHLGEKAFYSAWSAAIRNPRLYEGLQRTAGIAQRALTGTDGMIHRLPYPLDGWTRSRDLKPLAAKSFLARWKKTQ